MSAGAKIVPICNVKELHKVDSNPIIYDNLQPRQNQAPELEQQCWDPQGCKFILNEDTRRVRTASWFFLSP